MANFGEGGGVNFSALVYSPNYDMFARPVTFYPYASQPGGGAYLGRGIFSTRALDVIGLDGALLSDQQTILDIREVEFPVLPQQMDRLVIDAADAGPAEGEFEVTNTSTNGGGETTLVLRRWLPPAP